MSVHAAVIAPRCRPCQVFGEQRLRRRFAAVLAQPNHLAVHDVRQDHPESLALAALNLIEPDVPGLAFHARAIPFGEERFLGAASFAPAHAVADGRMARPHRLTVHADLLAQPSGDARLGVRELDALRPNAAGPARETPLRVDQRDVMGSPGQVVPRSISMRSYAAGAAPAAAAGVAPHAAPLNTNYQPAAVTFVHRHYAKSRQPENPRTIRRRDPTCPPLL
jgi:hypothetical protein